MHFYDNEDGADYCVLKHEFVTEHICCWMGEVRDAFVGVLQYKTNEFIPLTAENECYAQRTAQLEKNEVPLPEDQS